MTGWVSLVVVVVVIVGLGSRVSVNRVITKRRVISELVGGGGGGVVSLKLEQIEQKMHIKALLTVSGRYTIGT